MRVVCGGGLRVDCGEKGCFGVGDDVGVVNRRRIRDGSVEEGVCYERGGVVLNVCGVVM